MGEAPGSGRVGWRRGGVTEGAVSAPEASPVVGDAFVGRQHELAALTAALRSPGLIVLAGPPGVGKTRLAREVAGRLVGEHPDGVHLVELAPIGEAERVVPAVANVLSAWEQPGQSQLDTLVAQLRRRRMLLILDNCEHLVAAVAALAGTLLRACPGLTTLVTSQATLGVDGEQVRRVDPLEVPSRSAGLEALLGIESVRLFEARARAVSPAFRLTPAVAPVVAEICRQLDGVPLSIELAAARVSVLSPAEILSHLEDRFSLLSGDRRVALLARHPTLIAALDWSHELLPRAEQVLLRRLSVFARSCTLDAVQAVCAPDSSRAQLLASLTGLITRSLLQADTSGPRARYRMLETIRLYAAEQLDRSGEAADLRARHAAWYAELAELAEPALTGRDQVAWLDRLDSENDNLRAALRWSVSSQQADQALRTAGALTLFWRVRGRFREGLELLTAALAVDGDGAPVSRARALALWGAGFMALMLDDYEEAMQLFDQSRTLAGKLVDPVLDARAFLLLGNCWMFRDQRRALEILTRSAAEAGQVGDTWCRAHALGMLGRAHLGSGDLRLARPHLEECLRVARQSGDLQSLRVGLISLGELDALQGSLGSAEALLLEGIAVAEQLGEPYAVAIAHAALGELALQRGDPGHAQATLGQGLATALQAGSPVLIAAILSLLGRAAHLQGDLAGARARFQEGMAVAEEAGRRLCNPLIGLAELAMADGDWDRARALLGEALSLAREGQSASIRAAVLSNLGRLARAEGDLQRSIDHHQEALRLCQRIGHRARMVEALESLAGLWAVTGREVQAARLFGAVDALRRQHGFGASPMDRDLVAADLEWVRDRFSAGDLASLRAEGATLSLPDAVTYAARGRGAKARARTGWASLTPTELKIAELVAEGLSNADIARRQFISLRTVEGHVSRMFRKLAITSRTQLAREARAQEDRSGTFG